MYAQPDIAWSRQLSGPSAATLFLWLTAGLFALAAHGGLAWWLLQQRTEPMADGGQPPAIMIELAPIATAPEPETIQQLAPDLVDSIPIDAPDEVEPDPEPVPEPVVEPAVEPEPVQEPVLEQPVEPVAEPEPVMEPEPVVAPEPVAEPEPVVEPEPVDPVDEMIRTELDRVEVPLPAARPKQEPVRQAERPRAVETQRERPVRQAAPQRQPPSRAAARAQMDAQRSERTAAPRNSQADAPSISPARWQARLASHLERRKRYPAEARRSRQQGTALVRFSIDSGGNVGAVSLSQSSGHPALDQEVLALVRRASPVPAPPPGVGLTIVVPIRFDMR